MVRAADGAGLPVDRPRPLLPGGRRSGAPSTRERPGILFPRGDGAAMIRARGRGGASIPRPAGAASAASEPTATVPFRSTAVVARSQRRRRSLVGQIETAGALARASTRSPAIDGVDVLFVGPNDLTQALGIPGQYSTIRAIGRRSRGSRAAARGAGKAAGIMLARARPDPGARGDGLLASSR